MNRVDVSTDVLLLAIKRSGRSLENLTASFPKLPSWLTKEAQPTFKQLEDFAKKVYVPFGYMFLPEPPLEKLSIPYYRSGEREQTIDNSFDANLIDTVQQMLVRQEWMKDYLVAQGCEPIKFIGSANLSDDTVMVASSIRRALGLDDDWATFQCNWTEALRYLKKRIDDAGVLLVVNGIFATNTHRKLNTDVFRGFVLVDDMAPLLFLNGADAKAAQMFTLAHELAHLFLGESAAFNLRSFEPADNAVEKKCDQIAAEFLVSSAAMLSVWAVNENFDDRFQRLARRFKVSEIVVARRALDLNLITKSVFVEFYKNYCASEHQQKLKAGGGDYYVNQIQRIGARFGASIISAAREGYLLYSDAYRLTGMYGRTFDKFAEHLGLGA